MIIKSRPANKNSKNRNYRYVWMGNRTEQNSEKELKSPFISYGSICWESIPVRPKVLHSKKIFWSKARLRDRPLNVYGICRQFLLLGANYSNLTTSPWILYWFIKLQIFKIIVRSIERTMSVTKFAKTRLKYHYAYTPCMTKIYRKHHPLFLSKLVCMYHKF